MRQTNSESQLTFRLFDIHPQIKKTKLNLYRSDSASSLTALKWRYKVEFGLIQIRNKSSFFANFQRNDWARCGLNSLTIRRSITTTIQDTNSLIETWNNIQKIIGAITNYRKQSFVSEQQEQGIIIEV